VTGYASAQFLGLKSSTEPTPAQPRTYTLNLSIQFSAPDEATANAVRDSLTVNLIETTS
jgi:hypothetical protein